MSGDKKKSAAAALALFVANAWITWWFFHTSYSVQMGSIEAAYIGLARYIVAHFGDLNWFPLWYGGIPYPDTYPPLLHFMVAGVAACAGLSAGLAYHIVVAVTYSLGPVALFWAMRRLGAGHAPAFAGALLYSLISPSCFLIREVRADSGGLFGPRRLVALVPYGEGPHLTSLMFFALAIGMLHYALQKRRPLGYVAAAASLACVVLSNWIGAFALATAIGCYLLAGWDTEWLPRWLRAAAIGCYAYAIAMPWATPATIKTIRMNAPKLVGWESTPPETALALLMVAGILLLAWLGRRFKVDPAVRFGVMFLWGMAVVTLGATWFHIKMLPQPERYHLEMDLAFWLTATMVAARLPIRKYVWVAIVVACIPVLFYQHRRGRDMERPIDITKTAEYRISSWLGANLPGRRVFAPGTDSFWMTAFSDTPMLVGGFDNGIRNELLWAVNYQIYAGDKLENAIRWLQVLGCDAVVGDTLASGEFYHPYKYPDRFLPLKELWHDGAESIYAVPRVRSSLAHAVHASDLLKEAPPSYLTDPLIPFIHSLDDPTLPDAAFQWQDTSAATVTANLRPEHLLYLQLTWDEGWHARVNGVEQKTWADPLGQMVIEPHCDGPCKVEIVWDGGLQMKAARIICPSALVAGLLWILLEKWLSRKRSASTKTN